MFLRMAGFFTVLFLFAGGCADRDQSTAITKAINAQVDEMGRTGRARVSFTHQPGSTKGDGKGVIGDYTVILRGTGGNGEVRIIEKNGQTHSTYQFPRIVVPKAYVEVNMAAGEPLTIVLTRVGDSIELSEVR
jgi:IS5 family transposase